MEFLTWRKLQKCWIFAQISCIFDPKILPNPPVLLYLCMWETERNRNGGRDRETEIFTFYLPAWKCVCVCEGSSLPFLMVRVGIIFWRVWQIGALGCVIEATRTISLHNSWAVWAVIWCPEQHYSQNVKLYQLHVSPSAHTQSGWRR